MGMADADVRVPAANADVIERLDSVESLGVVVGQDLARVEATAYHVIGKYRGTSDDYVRSESALNRALELNPDLSIADHFYAQLEVADGRAEDAMVRLVRRASSHSSDPDLFAALVPACRYCGLLQHSLAAYERATRLDPNVRTSVEHTPVLAWGV